MRRATGAEVPSSGREIGNSQDVETAGNICTVKKTLSDNTILVSSFRFLRVATDWTLS